MTNYATNEFKNGLKIMLDGSPCSITECQFVKPGKGQAFTKIKYRNLKTGRIGEKTLKSGETVDGADVVDMEMQYLYNDGEQYHFMVTDTFEQYIANESAIADAKQWLKEQDVCTVTLWDNNPLSIAAANFVTLTITNTDPGLRGDTSGSGGKPATLETGAVVRVPLFVQIGEMIKVDTRTGEYVSRVK